MAEAFSVVEYNVDVLNEVEREYAEPLEDIVRTVGAQASTERKADQRNTREIGMIGTAQQDLLGDALCRCDQTSMSNYLFRDAGIVAVVLPVSSCKRNVGRRE